VDEHDRNDTAERASMELVPMLPTRVADVHQKRSSLSWI